MWISRGPFQQGRLKWPSSQCNRRSRSSGSKSCCRSGGRLESQQSSRHVVSSPRPRDVGPEVVDLECTSSFFVGLDPRTPPSHPSPESGRGVRARARAAAHRHRPGIEGHSRASMRDPELRAASVDPVPCRPVERRAIPRAAAARGARAPSASHLPRPRRSWGTGNRFSPAACASRSRGQSRHRLTTPLFRLRAFGLTARRALCATRSGHAVRHRLPDARVCYV